VGVEEEVFLLEIGREGGGYRTQAIPERIDRRRLREREHRGRMDARPGLDEMPDPFERQAEAIRGRPRERCELRFACSLQAHADMEATEAGELLGVRSVDQRGVRLEDEPVGRPVDEIEERQEMALGEGRLVPADAEEAEPPLARDPDELTEDSLRREESSPGRATRILTRRGVAATPSSRRRGP